MSERVRIYDTTLRDGMQREGLSLSVGEQLSLALRLAEFGVNYIEAGFPASNPKYGELFGLLEREDLGAARLAAFGMTRRRGVAGPRGPGHARAWPRASRPSSPSSARPGTCTSRRSRGSRREENLAMIEESIAFLVAQGKEVIYDAEHFFDAYDAHPEYALLCLRAAEAGGATWITPCDTNGATLPTRVAAVMRDLRAALPGVGLGIHTHNDAECGVANSLAAVEEGARLVQGTINGYGERCGNANLVSIIPTPDAEDGVRDPRPRAARGAHRPQQLRRRDGQPPARLLGPVRGQERLRPQGRDARPGHERRRPHLRAHRSGAGGQRAAGAGVRAVGPRDDRRQGARAGHGRRGGPASACRASSRA